MEDHDIYRLADVPSEDRQEDWETQFLTALAHARFRILIDEPQQGPDGWPYLLAQIDPTGTETLLQLIDWLSHQGVGLVLNPYKDTPDYVLTYGMIWNYKQNRTFLAPLNKQVPQQGQIVYRADQAIHAGPPSTEYWPDYARAVMREFLKSNGVGETKVLVLSEDQSHYDLCFSLESFGNPPATEHRGLLEALSWFLPPHYSLVLTTEKGLPAFHRL